MQIERALALGTVALLFAPGVFAQAKPDFSGSWMYDHTLVSGKKVDSDSDPLLQIVFEEFVGDASISIAGQKMTVYRHRSKETIVFMLNGTPSQRYIGDAAVTYTSNWEGTTLVTRAESRDIGTWTEKRWIGADGSMVEETTYPFGFSSHTTFVYKRK